MPTVQENLNCWQNPEAWSQGGDEWSQAWGGPGPQWYGSIYPRISPFIPVRTILEIAPGYGRWTEFLKEQCQRLLLVDLSALCLERCKERFSSWSHLEYYLNDGTSLAMIPDETVDFVFSFDSLVHAEAEVIRAYLQELSRKLAPDGVGFIHHSNLGEYFLLARASARLPARLKSPLIRLNILSSDHWRARTMTAKLFDNFCQEAGLRCISQELVNWGGKWLIDCFSTFARKDSKWSGPRRVVRNPDFMREAARIFRSSQA